MAPLIEVNDAEIITVLNRLLQTVENPRLALLEIAGDLKESTHQRFSTKTAPDGSEWDDNSAVTIARNGHNDPLIDETGKLMAQLAYEVMTDGLELFDTMEYAAMQQFGGTYDDKTNILQILNDHIEQNWR